MFGRFFGRKDKGPPRAHLVVEIDPATGAVGLDLRSPFTPDEAEAVLEAALGRARDMTEDVRRQKVDTIIRDAQRELGVMDKLRRRSSRWEAEARNVVPTEMFVGEAGRGLVEVTIDGELGFVTVSVAAETGPEGTPGLALEALRHAEEQAKARWFAVLKGALEELPASDKVELGLPAPARPDGAVAKEDDGEPAAGDPADPAAPDLDEATGAQEAPSEPDPVADGSHTAFPDAEDEGEDPDAPPAAVVLRQVAEAGQEADRRPRRVHLRRVHRPLQRDHRRGAHRDRRARASRPAQSRVRSASFLDDYVVGQDSAKKILSVAVYNHYRRIQHQNQATTSAGATTSSSPEVEHPAARPTGCGKTHLAQTLARQLNVPFAVADATALTEAGYVGEDVENILLKLIQAADFDVKRAETGHRLHRRDRQGRAQEREPVDHPRRLGRGRAAGAAEDPRGHPGVGAAAGRSQAPAPGVHPDRHDQRVVHPRRGVRRARRHHRVAHRPQGRRVPRHRCARTVDRDPGELFAQVLPEDLVKFGMIPEFIGRLPMIGAVGSLDRRRSSRSSSSRRTAWSSSTSSRKNPRWWSWVTPMRPATTTRARPPSRRPTLVLDRCPRA
jgi:DNA-binding protein YbaB